MLGYISLVAPTPEQQEPPERQRKKVKEVKETPNPRAKTQTNFKQRCYCCMLPLITDRLQPSKKMCIVTIDRIGDTSLIIK